MTLHELRDLLDYHYWARDRMLEAVSRLTAPQFVRGLGNSFSSIRDTQAHIYAVERVWCSRWQGTSPTTMSSGAEFSDVASLRRAWSEHEGAVRSVLEKFGQGGVDQVVEYRSIDGTVYRNVFWQMLQHVVNHASYHRGQVTTMLRQLGAEPPPSMDLITYYRERR